MAPLLMGLHAVRALRAKLTSIVSDDTANSTDGLKTVKGAFLAEGADVVYAKPNVPTTEQVDYTPFVQDVMTSNDGGPPDMVVFNSLFANTVGIRMPARSVAILASGLAARKQMPAPTTFASARLQISV